MQLKHWTVLLLGMLCISAGACQEKDTLLRIHTDMGDIVVRLYKETPKHRENFLKLADQGFYDSLLFHRVIRDFMIQGGDPNTKNAPPAQLLGGGGEAAGLSREMKRLELVPIHRTHAALPDRRPSLTLRSCNIA